MAGEYRIKEPESRMVFATDGHRFSQMEKLEIICVSSVSI
jgi:hypothetical protein